MKRIDAWWIMTIWIAYRNFCARTTRYISFTFAPWRVEPRCVLICIRIGPRCKLRACKWQQDSGVRWYTRLMQKYVGGSQEQFRIETMRWDNVDARRPCLYYFIHRPPIVSGNCEPVRTPNPGDFPGRISRYARYHAHITHSLNTRAVRE